MATKKSGIHQGCRTFISLYTVWTRRNVSTLPCELSDILIHDRRQEDLDGERLLYLV